MEIDAPSMAQTFSCRSVPTTRCPSFNPKANRPPGLDLQGNTYWEFRDTLSPGRMRRIVDYPPHVQYSDVSSHITPAWHQWLRHTRQAAPTLAEQELDVLRQRRVKVLAAQADERWEAKGRLVGGPGMRKAMPGLGMGDATVAALPETKIGRAHV